MSNPWGMTAREEQVAQAILETGSGKGAAMVLNISPITVSALMARAAKRMGARTRLLCLLGYDRWHREHRPKEAQP